MYDSLDSFLNEIAQHDRKFKPYLAEHEIHIRFNNSSGKYFTLPLKSYLQIFKDILDHFDDFLPLDHYVEGRWRERGAQYFTDELGSPMIGTQTKALFVALKKIIGWANGDEISLLEDNNTLGITRERLENTIEKVEKVLNETAFGSAFFDTDDTTTFTRQTLSEDYTEILKFPYRNILFKGVPGTGKSRTIDKIITEKLKLDRHKHQNNILHINIHSASSNADLMQGIGITTTEEDQVAYKEKQGLVYDLIKKACYAPLQPFVLILEEIQENSLNELIGDLIYLIEPSKRLKTSMLSDVVPDNTKIAYTEENGLVSKYIEKSHEKYNSGDRSFEVHSVNIPYLVSTSTEYRTMILPDNLFVFCTSNYRDDKKVIEDNLLRRFDVIELYPQYKDGYKNPETAVFLESLNHAILDVFHEEIHPDRFQIGHANWLKIEKDDTNAFYESLLKVVIDFKEIKEIESSQLLNVFNKTLETLNTKTDAEGNPLWLTKVFEEAIDAFGKEPPSYAKLVDFLQQKSYSDLLNLSENN